MKPKIVQLYETSTGTPVKTLAEWKKCELLHLLQPNPDNDEIVDLHRAIDQLVESHDEIIAILSVPEKIGRPPGSKNRKPSVKQTPKPTVVEAA